MSTVSLEEYLRVSDELETMRGVVEALRSALERTERNFVLAVHNKPVRDMTENLAENAAALARVSSSGNSNES